MLEREIQKQGEKALKAAFGHGIHLWTCDTGGFVPMAQVGAAIARIAAAPARWRIVLAALHPMKVGVTGGADTQGCLRRRWFGIEWKRPGEKQRESKVLFEREIRSAGGAYVVATSPEQALERLVTALGIEDERDELMERDFGPKSRVGRLRAKRAGEHLTEN